jgi:hypothetical protein
MGSGINVCNVYHSDPGDEATLMGTRAVTADSAFASK